MIQPPELPAIVARISAAAPAGAPLWLVGGVVRDLLLNRRLNDFDFVVAGDGLAVARSVADSLGAPYYPLDAKRGVGRVILEGVDGRLTFDFARARGPDLAADLAGRDFTINAMAIALTAPEILIDPLNGYADLRAKLIRACAPTALADDAVRTVRAVRLAAQLEFRLDPATRAAVRAAAPGLAGVSPERRRDEFIRCLGGARAPAALRALQTLGVLPHLAPEAAALSAVDWPPAGTAWDHTLATLARLQEVLTVLQPVYDMETASDLTMGLLSLRLGRHRDALAGHLQHALSDERPARWLLMLAALLHTAGQTERAATTPNRAGASVARARLAALRFSNDEAQRVAAIVAGHAVPLSLVPALPLTRRDIYHYFQDWGAAGVDAVLLAAARFLAAFDGPPPAADWNKLLDVASSLLRAYFENPGEAVSPPMLLTGDEVMAALGVGPGPYIGRLLGALREAQAAGEVGDREAALAFVRRQA